MPADPMPSPLDSQRQQDRLSQRESRRRQREIQALEPMVETVIASEAKAELHESVVGRFDADPAFREAAAEQRNELYLLLAFLGSLALYVFAETLCMGDLAETLGSSLAPLFEIDENAGPPLWLRRLAAGVIVGGMLGTTLLIKLVGAYYYHRFSQRRAMLTPGQERTDTLLGSGIWAVVGLKVGYLIVIAMVYTWIYDFTFQRAQLTHAAKQIAEDVAKDDNWRLDFESTTGVGAGNADMSDSNPMDDPATVAMLAKGPAVFYLFMVLLHGAILLIPVGNPVQRRPLAGLNQAKSESIARESRELADQTGRAIYNRIRTAPEAYRADLIELSTPIHAVINRSMGTPVISPPRREAPIPQETVAAVEPASWPDPYSDLFGGPSQHA